MNNKQLYQISKYSYNEAYLQSQLNMAGANLNTIMEKMEKNKNYLKTMNIITKIIMVVYVSLLIFLPITVFMNINTAIDLGYDSWAYFLGSTVMGAYFLVQVLYMLMFGLFYITGLFSGDVFKWLSTLPVKKDEMGKICIWTFFRGVDAPLIALMLVFPIATIIVTQNILVFIASIFISGLNTLFAFSMLIILGKKFTNLVKSADANSKKNRTIQIAYYIIYMVVTFIAVLGFQNIMPAIEPLFEKEIVNMEIVLSLNQIISWIPFPLSGGSLLTGALIGFSKIPTISIISSFLGLGVFLLLDIYLVKKASKVLTDIVYAKETRKGEELKESTVKDVQLTIISPLQSYRSKDIQMVGRDFQSLMMLLMPAILPTLGYIVGLTMNDESGDSFSAFSTIFILYGMMGAFMQTVGLFNLENSGATITATLPIIPRDQAKGKLQIMFTVCIFSVIIPGIFLIFTNPVENWYFIYFAILPIPLLSIVLVFLLRVRFFGKLKYKYVLEEVHLENKASKMIGIGAICLVFGVFISILVGVFISEVDLWIFVSTLLSSEIVIGAIFYYIFNRMFPRAKIFQ
ncbi:hypothetical protein NEF87_002579 [Candidatus Lokiarchaeum ossiferum]|uniref:Uncharacterized protein n=1 Tax=Candidatus Lokiarchaeum ossiferum TaxID=2951803 RepID=A0ABY6HUR3_9ARCH|nr:hypothetical protein NEF87_002579 [Candidatus Lokiarchaeum sp. B-35]